MLQVIVDTVPWVGYGLSDAESGKVETAALQVAMDTVARQKFPLVLNGLKSHNTRPMRHDPDDLIMLFNGLFREEYRTVLVRGGDEPEYLPATEPEGFAQVIFAHGYYASALHEISHWCIAGEHRRRLRDFGYWYCPDGRSVEQQRAFEQAEIKPQALEWLFSVAAGARFHISVDNLAGSGAWDEPAFRRNVTVQADDYLEYGLPARAGRFFDTLRTFYGTAADFNQAWEKETRRLMPERSATEIEVD
ncbi:MAG: hypothetical protein HLUCCO03_14030 [Marinobacter sp. HL-58]|nr:MAG: hypothetical protein HLUCCO03_14030 [Marinobacter sp. HL-58]